MKRYIPVVASAVAVLVGGATIASAQEVIEDIISIPVDSVLRAPPGSVTQIASAPVPSEFVGSDCIAEVESINQESVHPNNDLIIASGDTFGEVLDFESEAFADRGAEVPLTLGTTVTVGLRMGEDGVSSGGVLVTIDCTQEPPPTTAPPTTEPPTTEPPTTEPPTTEPPTTQPPTTQPPTTAPPTTAPPTTAPPTTVVNLPPTPTTTVASQPPVTELPATGSNANVIALAAFALTGGAALVLLARRRSSTEA